MIAKLFVKIIRGIIIKDLTQENIDMYKEGKKVWPTRIAEATYQGASSVMHNTVQVIKLISFSFKFDPLR